MTRNEAREIVMQLLFQMEVQKDFSDEAKEKFLEGKITKTDSQNKYINRVFSHVKTNLEYIDDQLNSASEKWNTSRMNKTDLAVLRVAIAEIKFMDDVPASVAINEAVTLGKKFGTDNSGKFINGVLGKIAG
ncbi:MAG: transcription antitermination factor NusB [Clostridia bacterium]|nr:transcription antitermination factor NusB [Clostridia bacterium]